MTWEDLLFMHWPVPADRMQSILPRELSVETYEGQAWLGIVPFRMSGVGFRHGPNLPFASTFPELNVRTYVSDGRRSGVWFFSLDATRRLAVWGGRRLYHLAYQLAAIQMEQNSHWIRYRSRRVAGHLAEARLDVEYRPLGPSFVSEPGSLEHFLTARYCLYSQNAAGRIYRAEVQHAAWQLQSAQAIIHENSMANPWGICLPWECPVLHFARETRVLAGSIVPVGI